MSNARFRLTVEDRQNGRSVVYDAENVVAALSSAETRDGREGEAYVTVFRAPDDETVGKLLAALLDRAYDRGGMGVINAFAEAVGRVPDQQRVIMQSEEPWDA